MEKSIADLLSDAFSDSSVPSFAEDEDFENLDFKVDDIGLSQDNNTADHEDFSPLSQNDLDFAPFVETYPYDDAQGTFSTKNTEEVKVRVRLEDCTSTEEESGEDESEIEEKPGDVLETDDEHVDAAGQDSQQEEEEGYFGTIQGHEGNLMIQDESSEEEHQTESTKTTFFQVEYTLEYPEISYDGTEEFNEDLEMENFSEEEHQEAGESFADYPSDFSSCEYVDDTRNAQPSNLESALDHTSDDAAEQAATGDTFLNIEDCFDESSELCGKEEIDQLEMTNKYTSLSEKHDKSALKCWSNAEEDAKGLSKNQTDLNVTWERQSENTEQNIPTVSQDETCLTTVSSSRGSVDDSFFFNDEADVYDVTEEEEMVEDEEEERRKEQARIQAFYRFYDEQDGDNKEERQTKVQFCMETLSQVIHYDTDSSRELSNSSDEEKEEEEEEEPEEEEEEEEQEDEKEEEQEEEKEREEEEEEEDTDQTDSVETCPSASSDEAVLSSSQELLEVEDLTLLDSPPEIPGKMTESTNKPICNRNHRCVSVLKLILSLFLVVAMGLIMFWWVSEAEEWSHFVL